MLGTSRESLREYSRESPRESLRKGFGFVNYAPVGDKIDILVCKYSRLLITYHVALGFSHIGRDSFQSFLLLKLLVSELLS